VSDLSFDFLLSRQRLMQEDVYGVDPAALFGDELADYLSMNVLAATDELHELLAECRWKTWQSNRGLISDFDAARSELADVICFVLNLALALDMSGQGITDRIEAAWRKNAQRQEEGY
jgi:NTP pyrophosphatase (non-canonical NTP hydrolase)